jgi:hypothetical protein
MGCLEIGRNAIRTLNLRASHSLILVVVGLALLLLGNARLTSVGELRDRTEITLAVVAGTSLTFETDAGERITVSLLDECKQRITKPPASGCQAYFEPGDEVRVWYDSADPRHVWQGSTPGGLSATLLFYAGVTLITVAIVFLWFSSGAAAATVRMGRSLKRPQ